MASICKECQSSPVTIGHLCTDCNEVKDAIAQLPEKFVIRYTDCEFNGRRAYLVNENTKYRVRFSKWTAEGLKEAVERYRDGIEKGNLYKWNW